MSKYFLEKALAEVLGLESLNNLARGRFNFRDAKLMGLEATSHDKYCCRFCRELKTPS